MAVKTRIDENTQRELLKEVLRRARKEEKQEHDSIVDRQNAIANRMDEITSEMDKLSERDKKNEYPKSHFYTPQAKSANDMSKEEFDDWMRQLKRETEESKQWMEKYDRWNAENKAIMEERMRLFEQMVKLRLEYDDFEVEEKWLLLSIVLRSQPNLLKYM